MAPLIAILFGLLMVAIAVLATRRGWVDDKEPVDDGGVSIDVDG
jgi:hypothetical protein